MTSLFDGKWRLVSADNVGPFFDAIKSPEGHKAKLLQVLEAVKTNPDIYVEELRIDGDKLTRRSVIGGQTTREVKDAPFNVEVEDKVDDGRQGKIKLVREGENKIIRTQIIDGMTITGTFEVKGDTLTLTQTSGSVTATMVYKK